MTMLESEANSALSVGVNRSWRVEGRLRQVNRVMSQFIPQEIWLDNQKIPDLRKADLIFSAECNYGSFLVGDMRQNKGRIDISIESIEAANLEEFCRSAKLPAPTNDRLEYRGAIVSYAQWYTSESPLERASRMEIMLVTRDVVEQQKLSQEAIASLLSELEALAQNTLTPRTNLSRFRDIASQLRECGDRQTEQLATEAIRVVDRSLIMTPAEFRKIQQEHGQDFRQ